MKTLGSVSELIYKLMPHKEEDKSLAQKIGEQVRLARLNQGMSQKSLAEKLNTDQAVISRLENGKGVPSISMLQKVTTALGEKITIVLYPEY